MEGVFCMVHGVVSMLHGVAVVRHFGVANNTYADILWTWGHGGVSKWPFIFPVSSGHRKITGRQNRPYTKVNAS